MDCSNSGVQLTLRDNFKLNSRKWPLNRLKLFRSKLERFEKFGHQGQSSNSKLATLKEGTLHWPGND